jgi:HD-GYP domain-containing protein (c-di-GMP phosphodiesterase class II)
LDGKGYPRGLSAEAITLETRIISVADFFDALTADRPYRKALTVEDALKLMSAQVGSAIDPACFEALKLVIDALPTTVAAVA